VWKKRGVGKIMTGERRGGEERVGRRGEGGREERRKGKKAEGGVGSDGEGERAQVTAGSQRREKGGRGGRRSN